MKLGAKQEKFGVALSLLTQYATYLGYGVRKGYLRRCRDCPVGKKNSVHKDKLAQDLLLFYNGKEVKSDTAYHQLHDFWDLLGGAPRIEGDLGHFSFQHQGRY